MQQISYIDSAINRAKTSKSPKKASKLFTMRSSKLFAELLESVHNT